MIYLVKEPGQAWKSITPDEGEDMLAHMTYHPSCWEGWKVAIVAVLILQTWPDEL